MPSVGLFVVFKVPSAPSSTNFLSNDNIAYQLDHTPPPPALAQALN
jgi:hypothetical protein